MPAGRPRTVSPPPEELEALGQEMLIWFEAHPQALHVSDWYCLVKFFTDNAWETMVKREEFVGYYEACKRIVGRNYLDKTSNVREGVSQRWQRVYFKDLRKEEDETADAEAARRANALKTEAKASEEEKQKVLAAVQRTNKKMK